MEKVAVVTGGSSGIGLCTAQALRKSGCTVYEISRRQIEHPDGIRHISADVTDEEKIFSIMAQILREAGHIDILVTCAGFGISGAAEFTDTQDAKRLLDVNLFGTVHAVRAVLGSMRAQGSGRIVCISSVAAPIAIPFQAWYSVSKAAISSYCAALREEVKPFGIEVCAILPGDIRTGFTAAREKSPQGDAIYGGRISRSVAVMEHDEQTGMDPQKAGDFICRVARKRRVKPYYAIGWQYTAAVMLARLLPARLLGFLVSQIYAK